MPYDPDVGHYARHSPSGERRRARRRPAKHHLFVRGPIPVGLIARCRLAHREALALLLRLKVDADTFGLPVVATAGLARSIGLHPKTRTRVLAALEHAGLIEVDRANGKAAQVWFDPQLFEVPR
jgi:hypothetical protein